MRHSVEKFFMEFLKPSKRGPVGVTKLAPSMTELWNIFPREDPDIEPGSISALASMTTQTSMSLFNRRNTIMCNWRKLVAVAGS